MKKLPNPEENDNISESDKTRIEEGHFSTIYTPDYYTWDKAWTAGGLNYERISRDLRSVRTVGRDESLKRTLFVSITPNRFPFTVSASICQDGQFVPVFRILRLTVVRTMTHRIVNCGGRYTYLPWTQDF